MNPLDNEEFKYLVKIAIKEWLDEQFAAFGRWTLYGILSALLAATIGFTLWVSIHTRFP